MSDTKRKKDILILLIRIIVGTLLLIGSIDDIVCSKTNPSLYEQVYTSDMLGRWRVSDLDGFVKSRVISCIVSLMYITLSIVHNRYQNRKWLSLALYTIDSLLVFHFVFFLCSVG